MNAYSFYLYGSPFFWLSTLFPQSWLPYLMCPLLVLKFAVAGGGAYLYMRRYVKNLDYAVLAACLYTFSGFGIYNIFFNHFIDVVALFPGCCGRSTSASTAAAGAVRLFCGCQPAEQLFLLCGAGGVPHHLLCLQGVHRGDQADPRPVRVLAFESLLGVALGCLLSGRPFCP